MVAFFAGWIQTGINKLLWGCAAAILIFGSLVIMEAVVETEREQIFSTIVSIARAVERGDHDAAVAHIHPSLKETRMQALTELARYDISTISVKKNLVMRLHSERDPLEASTGFNVVVRGSIAHAGYEDQHVPRYVHAEFVRDPDDNKWYVRTGLNHHAQLRAQLRGE